MRGAGSLGRPEPSWALCSATNESVEFVPKEAFQIRRFLVSEPAAVPLWRVRHMPGPECGPADEQRSARDAAQ